MKNRTQTKGDTHNYYERELDLIDFTGEHSAHVIFGSEGKVTKALAVNRESAAAIVSKLCALFFVDLTLAHQTPAPAPAPVPAKTRLYVSYKIGRDVNGNKILRVQSREGGFSIQTNGNLPQTHRDGVTSETDAEVCAYVAKHGTERQKRILGIL